MSSIVGRQSISMVPLSLMMILAKTQGAKTPKNEHMPSRAPDYGKPAQRKSRVLHIVIVGGWMEWVGNLIMSKCMRDADDVISFPALSPLTFSYIHDRPPARPARSITSRPCVLTTSGEQKRERVR